ncbi:MAG: lysophospholipid acyltransferase family protein [Rickettsiales bacterium]
MMRSLPRRIRDRIDYALVYLVYYIVGLLPPITASNIGGWLGRKIGRYVKRTRMAERLMEEHLPNMTAQEREIALTEMWDNLGRVLFEYPHLARGHLDQFMSVDGREHIQAAIDSGESTMIFSGHIGNWEMIPKAADMYGLRLHLVYRPPNNPLIDALIDRVRTRFSLGHYGKGKEGARGTMRAINKGESLGILVDQKDNEGALLPFLGSPAMTMTSAAKLALKYRLRVIPARAIREHAHQCRMVYYPPLTLPEGDGEDAVLALTQRFNDIVGEWVKERPGQWFWLHRRWPK